jgi:hypothetical protein
LTARRGDASDAEAPARASTGCRTCWARPSPG